MSTARTAFVQRVEAIRAILDNPIAIDNQLPARPNSPAVTIRNGCMVMLFCALESFVRDRAIEILARLDQATVPYTLLPEALKQACIVGTFEGLLSSTKYLNRADKIREFERVLPMAAAGLAGSNYRFSEYAFGKDKSNIGVEDIKNFVAALGVFDPWNRIKRTASRLGGLLTNNADVEFKTLATNRHKAAHVAAHIVDHTTISNSLPVAMALAVGYDVSISVAVLRMNTGGLSIGNPAPIVNDSDIKLRFIEPHAKRPNCWIAKAENARRASLTGTDADTLFSASINFARNADESLVLKDRAGRPSKWLSVLD